MGIFVCKNCGKEFTRAGLKERKYCSKECYHFSRRLTNEIFFENDYAYMLLTKDKITKKVIFDVEDISKINKHKWHLHLRKKDNRYDVCSNSFGAHKIRKYISFPRFLLNYNGSLCIDHINRNPLDNRKSNLRIVTVFQNNQNKSNNASGCVGVIWDKSRQNWIVSCKGKYIGRFISFEEAVKARKKYLTTHQIGFET